MIYVYLIISNAGGSWRVVTRTNNNLIITAIAHNKKTMVIKIKIIYVLSYVL